MPHTGQSGRVLSSFLLRASGPVCARVKARIWSGLGVPHRMASRMPQRDEEAHNSQGQGQHDVSPPGAGLLARSNTITSAHSTGLSAGAVHTSHHAGADRRMQPETSQGTALGGAQGSSRLALGGDIARPTTRSQTHGFMEPPKPQQVRPSSSSLIQAASNVAASFVRGSTTQALQ